MVSPLSKTLFKALMLLSLPAYLFSADRALIDTHIHYSHDAWERTPPEKALKILRDAGLQRAFVSSSSDEGTQKLYELAPELIIPVLRPYRRRGETSSWIRDESVVDMLENLLAKNTYAGIGEFHVWGDDANLPVIKSVVALAKKHHVFLHAHSDAEAIDILFQHDPDAKVLWAHSGFDDPEEIAVMLEKHPNLSADLAFRNEHANNGKVIPAWRELFLAYPDRIMIGTDTYTPERWYYIVDHAIWSREWLDTLPTDVADKIGFQNGLNLANWALDKQ
jgi:hypothetical protein